jgi:hypothetical protein
VRFLVLKAEEEPIVVHNIDDYQISCCHTLNWGFKLSKGTVRRDKKRHTLLVRKPEGKIPLLDLGVDGRQYGNISWRNRTSLC